MPIQECFNQGKCEAVAKKGKEYNLNIFAFSGGLSFSKFFCKFNNDDGHCERGIANSLYTFPSVIPLALNSTADIFKELAFDWPCST